MIQEIQRSLTEGRLDPESYVRAYYERIERREAKVRAFITLRPMEEVIKEVKRSVERLRSGRHGRLEGILIAVKDNISTMGIRTACGSKMLETYVPPFDATVIERIKREGGIIVGKTNMDEFAMGSTTETSYFGPTRNPWDLSRTPGGSSGGSGAALAAHFAELALGSDTGGSIRSPAAYNAVLGLKPSYGTVSRYGLIAYANSLEQIGPMARNANDLEILYSVIAGPDERDATTVSTVLEKKEVRLIGLRLGVLDDMMEVSEKPVKSVVNDVLNKLSSEGSELKEVKLGYLDYALPAYYIIAMSEASSNLARYDGVRYGYSSGEEGLWTDVYSINRGAGFGWEVKRRIMLGSFMLSAGYYEMYYIKALKIRRLIYDNIASILKSVDLILSPTMPILPPKIGDVINDPIRLFAMDVNTVVANLAGVPAISVPAGFYNGLPVGLQAMGPYLSDYSLISFARELEKITGYRDLTAPE
ncbi:MAG: Asp-tRNA(Asn)/Glu-tRNA(Gln) amidotransferase subunit GatA [Sulfolobaceae archaeon]|nr:Asp-tRNA(Asn)/Glu-tRNA(Gln) amidotransferase subunit GatA [Sulfolobales archaeon]